jgi:uridine kinase
MKPLIIGIAGGTGSGKSTFARKVADALDASSVAFIDMDAYYNDYAHLTLDERRRINCCCHTCRRWRRVAASRSHNTISCATCAVARR